MVAIGRTGDARPEGDCCALASPAPSITLVPATASDPSRERLVIVSWRGRFLDLIGAHRECQARPKTWVQEYTFSRRIGRLPFCGHIVGMARAPRPLPVSRAEAEQATEKGID